MSIDRNILHFFANFFFFLLNYGTNNVIVRFLDQENKKQWQNNFQGNGFQLILRSNGFFHLIFQNIKVFFMTFKKKKKKQMEIDNFQQPILILFYFELLSLFSIEF